VAAAADALIWLHRPDDDRLFGRALGFALALHAAVAIALLLQGPSGLADGEGGSPLQVEVLGEQALAGQSRGLPALQPVQQVEPVVQAAVAPDPAAQPSESAEATAAAVPAPLAPAAPPPPAERLPPPPPAVPLATPDPAVPPLAEAPPPMTMAAPAPPVAPSPAPLAAVALAEPDPTLAPVEDLPPVEVAAAEPPPEPTRAAAPPPPPVAQPAPPQPAAPPRAAARPAQRAAPAGQAAAGGAAPAGSGAAAPGSAAVPSAPPGEPPVVYDARYRTQPTPPPYPSYARSLNITGTVILRALVGRDGNTREVKVWRSSGHPQLDRAAYDAALKWAFAPASVGGQPIDAWVEVPVHFRLN
jgi:protein TonB